MARMLGLGTIAKLLVSIDADTKGLESSLGSAEARVKSFAATVEKRIDTRAFLAVGAAITGIGVGLGGLLVHTGLFAARVEVLETVMKTVGKTAGYSAETLAEQEEVIKKLGITTKSAREVLILFMQSQLDVADAAKIARVAQDLAVISGQNSSDATVTLTNAIVAQRPELLKQYGMVKTIDDIYLKYGKDLEIVTEKVDKSGKTVRSWSRDLTEAEKKQAFLNAILEEGEKVAGVYEEAMGDVGKQLTSIPRFIEEAKLALGEAFIPIIGKAVEILTELLKRFTDLSPETKKMITHIVMAAAGFALVVGSILTLIGLLPTLVAGFSVLLGPVGIAIAILAALGGIAYLVYRNWDTIGPKIMGVWERIKNFLIKTWETLKPKAIEIFGKIKDFLINTWNTLKPIVIEVWGKISDYLIRVWEKISTKLIPAAIRLQKHFDEINKVIMAKLVPVFKKLWDILKPIITVIGILAGAIIWLVAEGFLALIDAIVILIDWFLNLGTTWENIKAKAIEIWGAIKNFFISIWITIGEKAIGIWNSIKEFFVNLWEDIKGTIIANWDSIVAWFGEMWERVKEVFRVAGEAIWEWMLNWIPFLNIIVENWDEIVAKLKEGWDKILGFFIEKGTAIKDFIVEKFNAIRDFFIEIWTSISDFLIEIWTSISDFFIEIWEGIKEFFVELWGSIKEKAIEIWDSIKEFLINVFNPVKEKSTEIWTSIKEFIIETWEAIKIFFVETWNSIITTINTFKDRFLKVWNYIKEGLKSPINAMIGLINSLLSRIESGMNSMISALNRIGFKVPDWLGKIMPGIAGKEFGISISKISIPKIPQLQLGGYITRTGFVDVGERGRERIFLPRGAQVIPLRAVASHQEIHNYFSIDKLIVREEADTGKVAKELYDLQKSKQRGKGLRQ